MLKVCLVSGLFCCVSINAIITDGICFIAPSRNAVHLFSDLHPCLKDQGAIEGQLAILDDYVQSQPKRTTVILNEEPAQSLQERWEAKRLLETLSGVKSIAARYCIPYENIDLRASFIAATHIFMSYLDYRPYDEQLAFGPSSENLKKVADVTLDDLLQEKEQYIEKIKTLDVWTDREQKLSENLHKKLLDTVSGHDLDLLVSEFCDRVSTGVIRDVECAASNLSCFLLDAYTQKKIVHYSNDHAVLLVAGSAHTHNIKENLKVCHGWNDYELYGEGSVMSSYELKRMLGLVTWKDRLAQLCKCGWGG